MTDRRLSKLKNDLVEIFNRSQQLKNTCKCVKEFMNHYKQVFNTPQFDHFMQLFVSLIRSVLISERSSPFTKRTLDFITLIFKEIIAFEESKENERLENLVASEMDGTANTTANASDEDEFDELASEAFDPDQTVINQNYLAPISTVDLLIRNYFSEYLGCENVNIRYNTTSLIKKTLENFSEIDEETFIQLRTKMNDRTFDKDKGIRALAVLALDKLQNAETNDLVLRTLKFHLLRDPDATVRLCALKTIEVNSDSLRCLYMASRDTNNAIRKTAYSKLAQQCEIVNFTVEDRYTLLMNGINERDTTVKEVVLKKLIPSWIERLNNDLLKFIEHLNIKNDLKFADQLLFSYFESLLKIVEQDDITKFHKLVFDFKEKYLDEYRLLTKCPLTEEISYLWYYLCYFCKKKSVTYKQEERDDNTEDEDKAVTYQTYDLVDEIIPDIPNYCKFVEGFSAKMLEDHANNSSENKFVFTQLLNIGQLFKIKDEAQWNHVKTIFKKIIQTDEYLDVFDQYIEEIITIFSNYFEDDDERFLDLILEIINAINDHDANVPEGESQSLAIQQKLDNYEECLNEKYESKSNAILANDYDEMVRIKEEIDNLIIERQQLMDEQIAISASGTSKPPRMESDPNIFHRLLRICYGYFLSGKLKIGISRLSTLINKLVIPGLENNEHKIRALSIKTLSLYCLPSIELINHFVKVFLEIIEVQNYKESRIEALKFIFDFLCYHGFQHIKFNQHDFKNTDMHRSTNYEGSDNILERCQDSEFLEVFTDLVEKFLNEPIYNLQDQVTKPEAFVEHKMFEVAVKGVCKIMDLGRFYSEEFLARLIVIFFVYTKVEPSLRQFVEGFFYMYSFNFRKHMQAPFGISNPFVQAFEPCLVLLRRDFNINDQDIAMQDKFVNFFNAMTDDDQPNLMLKAANMLNDEENKPLWNLNLKLISKADFSKFTEEQLTELKDKINEFHCSFPVETGKRSRAKQVDKNAELAKKIFEKLQTKLANQPRSQGVEERQE